MHLPPEDHPHGHGLAEDLATIERLRRRRALAWLASTAAVGVPAWLAAGRAAARDDEAAARCTADPAETAGPYPADGSNRSQGSTSDILTASGVVRSDIRPSFIESSNIAQGVPVNLTLTLVNANGGCQALAGCAIYIWHCDRDGNYSLYTVPKESYLRGVQVADGTGQVSFQTIFPGCYSGRWPHIHFEVFSSLAAATSGSNALLTSQLALPGSVCKTVYASADGYATSAANLPKVTLRSDNVFGDNSTRQLRAMTPVMTGSVNSGYGATATIGLAL